MNKNVFIILSTLLICGICHAQTTLVQGGKAKAEIILQDNSESTRNAAELLQDFVQRSSGAVLPIRETASGKLRKGSISITTLEGGINEEDSYSVNCSKGRLEISGYDKGAIFGVVRILEDYLGIRYWAGNSVDVPQRGTIEIPEMNLSVSPAFRYRQSQSWSNSDPLYKMWHGLEEPQEVFIDKLWVHTFNHILPSDRFGKEHPEWYSKINGEHRPGHNSQWCLSNEEVFEAACTQLDSIFRANPGLSMISVSQNDGNNTYCTCDECMKIYEEEGAVSGAYVRFLNRLAERFPDKQFSTLAYLFTMKPPQKVKPLSNVNIMLCDIDCKREVSLTENASGREFVSALEGWSAISDNIFLWDYGINFDNVVSPFPNFHILQPNIRLFRDNHVKMHFSQVNGSLGTDFSELRAYMIIKLMWNPDLDASELEDEFLRGYYGAAAPFLREYLDKVTAQLLASGKDLWIYDSPITHKDGCLNDANMQEYKRLFDLAEEAVALDAEKLDRVRISRLSLQYAELEIARTRTDTALEDITSKLDLFESRSAQYNIPTLNERQNRPGEYCVLYRERFLPVESSNLARGANVSFNITPSGRYSLLDPSSLVDGLYGGTTYVESWIGWEGQDAEIVIDLGCEKEFSSLEADFLHQLGAWVLLPEGGTFSVSTDGENYSEFCSFTFPEDRELKVKFVKGGEKKSEKTRARYIKLHVNTLGLCPDWHYGVGHPAWFFIDEIIVN